MAVIQCCLILVLLRLCALDLVSEVVDDDDNDADADDDDDDGDDELHPDRRCCSIRPISQGKLQINSIAEGRTHSRRSSLHAGLDLHSDCGEGLSTRQLRVRAETWCMCVLSFIFILPHAARRPWQQFCCCLSGSPMRGIPTVGTPHKDVLISARHNHIGSSSLPNVATKRAAPLRIKA